MSKYRHCRRHTFVSFAVKSVNILSPVAERYVHLSRRVTLHVDNVNILGQLEAGVGGDGRSLNGNIIGLVEESVGFGWFPPRSSLWG
jgi:hypothetical protein